MKDAGVPSLYVKSFHSTSLTTVLYETLTSGWGGDEMGIREVFQRARLEAPCLLVLEDLDSLINDNNRSFFLNEVDGIEDNDGLLMVNRADMHYVVSANVRSVLPTTSIGLIQPSLTVLLDSTGNSKALL
jgi:AAA+ superfamily predicted ATPase